MRIRQMLNFLSCPALRPDDAPFDALQRVLAFSRNVFHVDELQSIVRLEQQQRDFGIKPPANGSNHLLRRIEQQPVFSHKNYIAFGRNLQLSVRGFFQLSFCCPFLADKHGYPFLGDLQLVGEFFCRRFSGHFSRFCCGGFGCFFFHHNAYFPATFLNISSEDARTCNLANNCTRFFMSRSSSSSEFGVFTIVACEKSMKTGFSLSLRMLNAERSP